MPGYAFVAFLPPRPTGQFTEVLAPTLLFQSGLTFER